MALSVSWLDARLNKEAKETVVKADRDGLSARVSPKGKIVFQFRLLWNFLNRLHSSHLNSVPKG